MAKNCMLKLLSRAANFRHTLGQTANEFDGFRYLLGNRPVGKADTHTASNLWLADEAKIETEQEEYEMDDSAVPADLGCLDKTCPQHRHRRTEWKA